MNQKWERVVIPNNLPPIDLYSPASRPSSSSPPPGRPEGLGGRGRESPGSQSDQKQSKAAKKEDS